MKHRETLCITPNKLFKQNGALWQCDCGKVYRFRKWTSIRGGKGKAWEYAFTKEEK